MNDENKMERLVADIKRLQQELLTEVTRDLGVEKDKVGWNELRGDRNVEVKHLRNSLSWKLNMFDLINREVN